MKQVICPQIMSRVFTITLKNKNPLAFGTAFSIPIDGYSYFITSASLLQELSSQDQKLIYRKTELLFHTVHYTDYFVEPSLDLAILKTTLPVKENEERDVSWSSENMILGQDLYILGFPYLDRIIYPDEKTNEGFPWPLIKKTTLSVIRYPTFLLDSCVNSGFAGGPVVYWDYVENRQKICGIVAPHSIKEETSGMEDSSTLYFDKNSGFGTAYDISVVRKIIESSKDKKNKTSFLRLV